MADSSGGESVYTSLSLLNPLILLAPDAHACLRTSVSAILSTRGFALCRAADHWTTLCDLTNNFSTTSDYDQAHTLLFRARALCTAISAEEARLAAASIALRQLFAVNIADRNDPGLIRIQRAVRAAAAGRSPHPCLPPLVRLLAWLRSSYPDAKTVMEFALATLALPNVPAALFVKPAPLEDTLALLDSGPFAQALARAHAERTVGRALLPSVMLPAAAAGGAGIRPRPRRARVSAAMTAGLTHIDWAGFFAAAAPLPASATNLPGVYGSREALEEAVLEATAQAGAALLEAGRTYVGAVDVFCAHKNERLAVFGMLFGNGLVRAVKGVRRGAGTVALPQTTVPAPTKPVDFLDAVQSVVEAVQPPAETPQTLDETALLTTRLMNAPTSDLTTEHEAEGQGEQGQEGLSDSGSCSDADGSEAGSAHPTPSPSMVDLLALTDATTTPTTPFEHSTIAGALTRYITLARTPGQRAPALQAFLRTVAARTWVATRHVPATPAAAVPAPAPGAPAAPTTTAGTGTQTSPALTSIGPRLTIEHVCADADELSIALEAGFMVGGLPQLTQHMANASALETAYALSLGTTQAWHDIPEALRSTDPVPYARAIAALQRLTAARTLADAAERLLGVYGAAAAAARDAAADHGAPGPELAFDDLQAISTYIVSRAAVPGLEGWCAAVRTVGGWAGGDAVLVSDEGVRGGYGEAMYYLKMLEGACVQLQRLVQELPQVSETYWPTAHAIASDAPPPRLSPVYVPADATVATIAMRSWAPAPAAPAPVPAPAPEPAPAAPAPEPAPEVEVHIGQEAGADGDTEPVSFTPSPSRRWFGRRSTVTASSPALKSPLAVESVQAGSSDSETPAQMEEKRVPQSVYSGSTPLPPPPLLIAAPEPAPEPVPATAPETGTDFFSTPTTTPQPTPQPTPALPLPTPAAGTISVQPLPLGPISASSVIEVAPAAGAAPAANEDVRRGRIQHGRATASPLPPRPRAHSVALSEVVVNGQAALRTVHPPAGPRQTPCPVGWVVHEGLRARLAALPVEPFPETAIIGYNSLPPVFAAHCSVLPSGRVGSPLFAPSRLGVGSGVNLVPLLPPPAPDAAIQHQLWAVPPVDAARVGDGLLWGERTGEHHRGSASEPLPFTAAALSELGDGRVKPGLLADRLASMGRGRVDALNDVCEGALAALSALGVPPPEAWPAAVARGAAAAAAAPRVPYAIAALLAIPRSLLVAAGLAAVDTARVWGVTAPCVSQLEVETRNRAPRLSTLILVTEEIDSLVFELAKKQGMTTSPAYTSGAGIKTCRSVFGEAVVLTPGVRRLIE